MQPLTGHVEQEKLDKIINSNKFKIPEKIAFFLKCFQETISDIPLGVLVKKLEKPTTTERYMDKVASEFSADEKNSYTGFSSFLEKNKIIELNTLLTSSPYIIHFDRTFDSKKNIKIIHGFTNEGGWFNQDRCLYFMKAIAKYLYNKKLLISENMILYLI